MIAKGSLGDIVVAALHHLDENYVPDVEALPPPDCADPVEAWDAVASATSKLKLTTLVDQTSCACDIRFQAGELVEPREVVVHPNITALDLSTTSLPSSAPVEEHITALLSGDTDYCGYCNEDCTTKQIFDSAGPIMLSRSTGGAETSPWPSSFDILREKDFVQYTISSVIIAEGASQWKLTESGIGGAPGWAIYTPKITAYHSQQGPLSSSDDQVDCFLDEEGRWACLHCGAVFSTRGGASLHALFCAEREEMQCLTCGQWLHGEWEWENHEEFHRSGFAFRCRLGCANLWFGRNEALLEHHKEDHGLTYRQAIASKSIPVPLLKTAQTVPNKDGTAKYTSPPRRFIDTKQCNHCLSTIGSSYRFLSSDDSTVLCKACKYYQLSKADDSLPPPSLLARRRTSPPRKTKRGGTNIVRKAERRAMAAATGTVTCANDSCGAVVRVEDSRNTNDSTKFLCVACATYARRNAGSMRPPDLRAHQERRAAGVAYVRPDHRCGHCGVTAAPRWYRTDTGHLCAYCRIYEKLHNGDARPLWLEAERTARGITQKCSECSATASRTWYRVAGSVARRCMNCYQYWKTHGKPRPKELELYRSTSERRCSCCLVKDTPKWFRDGQGGFLCLACNRHKKKYGRLPTAAQLAQRKPSKKRKTGPVPTCSNQPCDKPAKTAGLCATCYDFKRRYGQQRPVQPGVRRLPNFRSSTAAVDSADPPAAASSSRVTLDASSPSDALLPRPSSPSTARGVPARRSSASSSVKNKSKGKGKGRARD